MVAGDGLADVLVISDGKVSASVHRWVQILGDGELVARLESDLAEHILIVGIDANRGIVDLPLGVAADSAAADDGVVARLIEGVAIVGVQIEVDGRKGVGQRLGLLPALAVHPREVAEGEWRWLDGRSFGTGHARAAGCGRGWRGFDGGLDRRRNWCGRISLKL